MKELVSLKDYSQLFNELKQIRMHRSVSGDRIHSEIKRRSGRKHLDDFVKKYWEGGYVYLESGDYLYTPPLREYGISIRITDPYCPEQIIPKLCKPGNIVMDIGANIGEWTLYMAKMVGDTGRVFSIDPIPSMIKALKKTIAINQLSQVSITECAISNKIGHTEFVIPFNKDNQAESGLSYVVTNEESSNPERLMAAKQLGGIEIKKIKTIKVPTVTLDELVSEKSIKRLDFIKIDVERHEREVLEGGQQTLKNLKPSLVLEVGNEKRKEDREKIADQLRTLDYEIIGIILSGGITELTWSKYLEMDSSFISCTANLLFLPTFKSQ
jgi:FkbM family methyltransferase